MPYSKKNKIYTVAILCIFIIVFICYKQYTESPHFNVDQSTISKQDSIRLTLWQEDLRFIKNKFETEHYQLFRKLKEEDWNNSFKTLSERLLNLKDHEIITETMKIIAKVGDGHSALYPPFDGEHHFHQIPVAFQDFEDGVYIKGADSTFKSIVGSKLLGINGVGIQDIKERLKLITNRDNDQWIKILGVEVYMTLPEILYALDISNTLDTVTLDLENEQGIKYSKEIVANLFDIAAVRNISVRPDWVAANVNSTNPLPLYLKHTTKFPKDFYWFTHLEQHAAVYCQINVLFDNPEENFETFCKRLFQFLHKNDIQHLIIDIRLNSGGNNQLNHFLIDPLVNSGQLNQKGRLFVITGPRTFSAAMNLATRLEQRTNATFIGEPTGSSPNFVGEDNPSATPNHKIMVSASTRYWQDSSPEDERDWITPHIENKLTYDQYRNNLDPNMETILKIIGQHIKSP